MIKLLEMNKLYLNKELSNFIALIHDEFSESLAKKLENSAPNSELALNQSELIEIHTKSKKALEKIKVNLSEHYTSKFRLFLEVRASYLNTKKELSEVASSLGIDFEFEIPNVPAND